MTATAQHATSATIFDTTTARVRELNESLVTEAKKAGNVTLDAYETTLHTLADYTEKIGASSPIELVSAVTAAQAKATRELTAAYTKAARALLN
jgi:hypothetical protein